jgi:hypothetical protein
MEFTLDVFYNWFEGLKPSIIDNIYDIDVHNTNVNQELKSNLQIGTLLVMFSPEIDTAGENIDNSSDLYSGMIFIIKKLERKSDGGEAERKKVLNDTLQTAKAIRKEIFKIASDVSIDCHFWKRIEHRSVKFRKLGPVFNNMYGWTMEFSFFVPFE